MRDRFHRAAGLAQSLVLVLVAGCAPEPTTLDDVLPTLTGEVEIQLVTDDNERPLGIEVIGLAEEQLAPLRGLELTPEDWQRVLEVAIATESNNEEQGEDGESAHEPLDGDHRVTENGVRFLPRVPLERNQEYVAIWHGGGQPVETLLKPSRGGAESTTRISAIYPTPDVLPANLLALHFEFSGPVARGNASEHLRLINDGSGEEVPLPIPAPEEEDWNEEGTVLTLHLAGPQAVGESPLKAGKRYRLVVDRGWTDAEGSPLRADREKLFVVDDADDNPPNPEAWVLTAPTTPATPLIVQFDNPLDHEKLRGAIEVRLRSGEVVAGTSRISDGEKRWEFRPEDEWAAGAYLLRISGELADPAGNTLVGSTTGQGSDEEVPSTALAFEVVLPEEEEEE